MQTEPRENILLVDDHPENLVALESVLSDLGQNLVMAHSGREALKHLLQLDFAVILLDVQMPEIDGFETATLIRARERSQHTPIIFLTAINKNETHVSRGYSVGAVDYVFKPFQPDVLRAKVLAFVELARKKRELEDEITRRKQAEEEVRLLNQDLERRVQERTRALEDTNRELETEVVERRRAQEEVGRLLSLEQAARAEAEAARKRLEFLGEASAILAGSLDYEVTLESVARLAVPYMADFCIVDLVGEDGQIRRVAVAHADEAKLDLLRRLQREYAPDWSSPQPAARVLRSGHPEVATEVDDAWLSSAARNQAHLEVWRALAPVSYMAIPLIARGSTIGVMSFAYSGSARRYGPTDPALARDLAGRAAAGIDNARLFREVQEAGQRKDEFLAMLAHELRNPLAAISNAAYALEALGPDDARRIQRLRNVIARQTQHLSRLVDDLLDISRITQGKIELRKERVELAELVEQAVDATQAFIESRGHALTVELPDAPVLLDVDPTRIEQVLCNLLNNAAKYTEESGRIWLRAEQAGFEGAPCIKVSVKDTGVGIQPDLLPRIFDLFTQAERAADRAQGGLGIGLALVRNLVTMHGGRVEAHSAGVGEGSEFVVYLPTLMASRAEARPPVRSGNGVARQEARTRILLVEDNKDAAETLSDMLALWGHEVRAVGSGPEALEAAPVYRPEVVLMDIGLPGMDGYETARRLREHIDYPLLLVALTGYGMEESRRQSADAGFDHHLTKPVEPEALRELLSRAAESVRRPADAPARGSKAAVVKSG